MPAMPAYGLQKNISKPSMYSSENFALGNKNSPAGCGTVFMLIYYFCHATNVPRTFQRFQGEYWWN